MEPEEVKLTLALAAAELEKGQSKRISVLSRLSIPYWLVQVAPGKSIVVSAIRDVPYVFEMTEHTRLAELKRVVGSEIVEPDDVPTTVDKMIRLLGSVQKSATQITGIVDADVFPRVAQFIREVDPNTPVNTPDIRLDSNAALAKSQEFQKLVNTARTRVSALEDTKRLVSERLRNHLSVLENLLTTERTRWEQRISAMTEKLHQDTEALKKKESDALYELREKQKMALRALTADFSRSMSDIEQYFSEMLEKVRLTRMDITKGGDDVENAVRAYQSLTQYLSASVAKYNETLHKMNARTTQLLEENRRSKAELEKMTAQTQKSTAAQITAQEQKLVDLKKEMTEKIAAMENLLKSVRLAIEKMEHTLDEQILLVQSEFLRLMSMTLDANAIPGLTPLTRLDIEVYVVFYDDGTFRLYAPGLSPDERVPAISRYRPLDSSLDVLLKNTVQRWIESDRSFKEMIHKCSIKGNRLTSSDGASKLREGIIQLERRMLLQEGAREKLESLWVRYAAKCPKCGADVAGSKYCPQCGLTIS